MERRSNNATEDRHVGGVLINVDWLYTKSLSKIDDGLSRHNDMLGMEAFTFGQIFEISRWHVFPFLPIEA